MIGMASAARWLLLCGLLSGLVAPATASPTPQADPLVQRAAYAVAEADTMRRHGQRVWCVTFARTASGIQIKGNAVTWWAKAAALYDRGAVPKVGAVMAFAATRKMRMGHVAVVARVVSDRVIQINHANWKRNQVSLNMTVVDVSKAGDWSAVRVESQPGSLGAVFPVNGFIYPPEVVASR